MNQIVSLNTTSTLTMSSLQIAELVESNHADVRRSMERLAHRGVITLPPMAEVSNTGPGPKTVKAYLVGKRDTYVIVAQLSPEFTARLVDRWQELEQAATFSLPDFSNPAMAARAWAAEFEQKQLAQAQVAELKPMAVIGARAAAHEHSLNRFIRTLPGINSMAIKKDLMAHNYLRKAAGTYVLS